MEIISYRDDSSDVYFMISGRVQVTMYSPAGRVITFQDLSAGSMFGEIGAIDGQPRTASIRTLTETHDAQMTGRYFYDLLWRIPSVGSPVLKRLTGLVRFLCERVMEFQALPVSQRIHTELLRLASAEAPIGKTVELSPAPTHADIASRVGTHREAVTRELLSLQKLGFVTRRGRTLIILDIDRLTELVQSAWDDSRAALASRTLRCRATGKKVEQH